MYGACNGKRGHLSIIQHQIDQITRFQAQSRCSLSLQVDLVVAQLWRTAFKNQLINFYIAYRGNTLDIDRVLLFIRSNCFDPQIVAPLDQVNFRGVGQLSYQALIEVLGENLCCVRIDRNVICRHILFDDREGTRNHPNRKDTHRDRQGHQERARLVPPKIS